MSYFKPGEPMKQLSIDELITELQKKKDTYGGNAPVYYHIAFHGDPDTRRCPLEVEAVEVRKGFCGDDKVTIV